MIITESQTTKYPLEKHAPSPPENDPPPYEPHSNDSPPPPVQVAAATSGSRKSVNYVSISRPWGAINEKLTLDPNLYMPSAVLPPLRPDEDTRKNLFLEAYAGSIYADVTLVGGPNTKASMEAIAYAGRAWVDIHRVMASPRIDLSVTSAAGSVVVRIPRDFEGLVMSSVPCGVLRKTDAISQRWTMIGDGQAASSRSLSPSIPQTEGFSSGPGSAGIPAALVLSRLERREQRRRERGQYWEKRRGSLGGDNVPVQRGFIGDLAAAENPKEMDKLYVEAKAGSVMLLYEGEETWGEKMQNSVKGAVGKLFGGRASN